MRALWRLAALAAITILIAAGPAHAGDQDANGDWKPLPDSAAKPLIAAVQRDWRARSGETAHEIIARLSSVAHFVPRKWYAEVSKDGKERAVSLQWVHNKDDADDESLSVTWDIAPDGRVLGTDDRLFDLGSSAFAVDAIQNDVNEERADANVNFLRDPTNLNFVVTPQGKLGDLLAAAKCRLANPTYVSGVIASFSASGKAYVQLQATVNCRYDMFKFKDIVEGTYNFTNALVAFVLADGETEWVPASFLAARIWNGRSGHWAEVNLPVEQAVFGAAKAAAAGAAPGFAWPDAARVVEIRNSAHPLADNMDAMRAVETVGMLVRIQRVTGGKVTPRVVEGFLRHAGIMATTMSDEGIIQMVPLMGDGR